MFSLLYSLSISTSPPSLYFPFANLKRSPNLSSPSVPTILLIHRKDIRRSHSLRYVLKDRNTDRLLFAITFTLYLKEDVDEEGNVKEGVEAGVPIELMSKEGREKHEKMVDGEVGVEGHHNDAAEENKKPAAAPPPVAETNDDDVD